ncbi:hypothetical protein Tco_1578612 [Tanacetum coccineum]
MQTLTKIRANARYLSIHQILFPPTPINTIHLSSSPRPLHHQTSTSFSLNPTSNPTSHGPISTLAILLNTIGYKKRRQKIKRLRSSPWKALKLDGLDDDFELSRTGNTPLHSYLLSIEPKDSLIIGDEHLSTFSIEEIIPILRESDDTSMSDSKNVLPSCDDFSSINVPRDDSMTFFNPLFEFDVNFNSSDINPLFDEVLEDIECKDSYDSNLDESTFLVTPLSNSNKDECFTPGDDIEFLLHHDPSTPLNSAECFDPRGDNDKIDAFLAIEVPTYIEEGYYDSEGDILYLESFLSDDTTHNLSPKVFFDHEPQHIENESDHDTFSPKSDPLHHDFAGSVITIPPRIVREHEDYINRMSLLYGNSSSQSPKNSHIIITYTTLIEDSDSNREEIDIFSGPDDSMPPGIESDFDSKEDIIDNLLNDVPIPEYECLTFDVEPDVPMINNVDELNKDECFDPGEVRLMLKLTIPLHLSLGLFFRILLTLRFLPYFPPPRMRTPFLTPVSPLRACGISSG